MSADVNAAMDALGARLATIAGLRVYDYPPDSVAVPAAVVSFPTVEYDVTYQRAADRLNFEVIILVSRVSDRESRDKISAYMVGTGAASVKAAVDGDLAGAVHSARVATAEVRSIEVNGITYIGAVFSVEVIQ